MSTEIKNVARDRAVRIKVIKPDIVEVGNHSAGVLRGNAWLPRTDFLAAVSAECNVIIIDKADLPEVLADWERELLAGADAAKSRPTEDKAWRAVLSAAAEWEYVKANPPVDEAQVEAIRGILANHGDGGIWEEFDSLRAQEVARVLVERGVRIEIKP